MASALCEHSLRVMLTRDGSLTVLHTVPAYVRARTRQLGITRSAYLAILLSNYLTAGKVGLSHVEGRDPKCKRVDMQATLPVTLREAGMKVAARYNISFSRLMESLIVRDAWSEEDEFVILPKTRPKAKLTGVK